MKEGGNYTAANGKEDFNKFGRIEHHDGDTDDSKDSDAVQLFELPKRKLVRPISSSLRRKVRDSNRCWATTKECCRVFVTVTVPMLIAVFIVSTILCLAFLLVGIAGMKQEISILKSRLKNVDAAEQNFLAKKEQLRKQFRNKLNDLVSYQTELQKVQSSVRRLSFSLDQLNITMHKFHRKPASKLSSRVTILKNDLDTVKTGMADTGADIEKLKANGKELSKHVGTLQSQLASVNQQLYNITVEMSLIQHKKPPALKATPKMLVVSMTSELDKPVNRRELNHMLEDLEKRQNNTCLNEVSRYDHRLEKLYNETLYMNKKYADEISQLHHSLYVLQHPSQQPSVSTGNMSRTLNATAVKSAIHTNATGMPLQNSSSVTPTTSAPSLQTVNITSHATHVNISNINSTSVANLTNSKSIKANTSKESLQDEEDGAMQGLDNEIGEREEEEPLFHDVRSDEKLEAFEDSNPGGVASKKRKKKRSLRHFFDIRKPD